MKDFIQFKKFPKEHMNNTNMWTEPIPLAVKEITIKNTMLYNFIHTGLVKVMCQSEYW